MANEAIIHSSMIIRKGNHNLDTGPITQFQADVNAVNSKGPAPGAFTASVAGTDVDLSALTNPSLCIVRNFDVTNFVTIGVWDGTEFYPLYDVDPGEFYVVRLSRLLGTSLGAGTGTGTFDTGTYTMRIKANTADCAVSVEANER